MKTNKISHQKTGYFSSIMLDYLEGKSAVNSFYKYKISIDSFKDIIADKAKEKINRPLLVEVLKQQNKTYFNDFPIIEKQINELGKSTTFTITTGHQLCVFGGPLYFIYKIVSTINLCEKLKKTYPNNNFIPVFWLASEDHGNGEVSKINLFGKTLDWKHTEEGSVGERTTDGSRKIIEELKNILGTSENATYLLHLWEESYLKHDKIIDATRHYLTQLFGEKGLVLLDGNDAKLKQLFAPIIADELINSSVLNNVNEVIEKLSVNYKTQVTPREINLFYLQKGKRNRIIRAGKQFKVLNTNLEFSKKEILLELEKFPEKFSPNVLMRPIYQEKILPNLAYIGGGGEAAYWLELKKILEYYKINFPMIILRNSAQIFTENSVKKLNKLGISTIESFLPYEQLVNQYLAQNSNEISLKTQKEAFVGFFKEMEEKANKIDKSLVNSVKAEQVKLLKAVDNIESKLKKAEKKKNEVQLNQLQKVKETLYPNNGLQERYDNFMPYYLTHGKAFFDVLFDNFDVLEKNFICLNEKAFSC